LSRQFVASRPAIIWGGHIKTCFTLLSSAIDDSGAETVAPAPSHRIVPVSEAGGNHGIAFGTPNHADRGAVTSFVEESIRPVK